MNRPLRQIDPQWSFEYMKCDPTDFLVALYEDYCLHHDLPLVSADEQDLYHLPPKQRAWIHSFIVIWDSLHA